MDEEFKRFREAYLNVVDVVDWYKLVEIATVEEFEEGDLVCHQVSVFSVCSFFGEDLLWRVRFALDAICPMGKGTHAYDGLP